MKVSQSKHGLYLGIALLLGIIRGAFIGGVAGSIIMFISLPFWIWGFALAFEHKGYSRWLGATAIFPPLAIIIYLVTPNKKGSAITKGPANV